MALAARPPAPAAVPLAERDRGASYCRLWHLHIGPLRFLLFESHKKMAACAATSVSYLYVGSVGELADESELTIALQEATLAEIVLVADVGVPVAEVEAELLNRQRDTNVPVCQAV